MSYMYGGPIGSTVNGIAAFLSEASSYFLPISLSRVVVSRSFVDKLISLGQLGIFLETYGSLSLNFKHFQSLDENVQEVLEVLVDKDLVEILDLKQENTKLFEMLRSRLNDEESLSLAQALDSGVNMVFVESEEAKNIAIEFGIRPLSYEDFLLEAYKRGLVSSAEILKILL